METERTGADGQKGRRPIHEMTTQVGAPAGSPTLPSMSAPIPVGIAPAEAVPLPRNFGRYRLLRLLGRGGMGEVYLAEDPILRRQIALKTLRPGQSEASEARFLREARIVARLDHPGIIKIFDVGTVQGTVFFTMELLSGRSLRDFCDKETRVSPQRACVLVKEAAEALHYAHSRGVVHRDIKPANILLNEQERPKLADFGLAGRLDRQTASLTQSGQIMGTPAYMSPEQATGMVHAVDARSDVYSLGCVLYELLTGQEPLTADTMTALLRKIADEDPVDPRKLDAAIPVDAAAICMKAIEKSPWRRYASAGEFAQDLGRFIGGYAVRARPVGPAGRLVRYVLRNRKRVAVLSAIVLACAGLLTFMTMAVRYRNTLSVLREQEGGPPSDKGDYSLRFLLKAMSDADWETRVYALAALARRADRAALDTILRARSDADVRVRLHVCDLVPRLPQEDARSLLVALAGDADPMVRAKALDQVSRQGMDGFGDRIAESLRSANPLLRVSARRALTATLGEEEIRRILAEILMDASASSFLALEVFSGMIQGSLPPLLSEMRPFLNSPDERVRTVCLSALRRATGQDLDAEATAWGQWLERNGAHLSVRAVGLVVSTDDGPLREEDVIVAVNGRPAEYRNFARWAGGDIEVIRRGQRIRLDAVLPGRDFRIYPSYVVFMDDKPISRGEVETRMREASGAPARETR